MTNHSESGTLTSVFIKKPEDAFISDIHLANQWQSHNYLSQPNFELALKEYENFEQQLRKQGCEIHYFPKSDTVSIDSIYCRDAAIATNEGMIICNMGKPQRKNEPEAEKIAFLEKGIPVLGEIKAPGTVEGGDVAWLDEKTLAVGHTYRTNLEGIYQLRQLLEPLGIELITVDLPHYRGPSDVFHLMSILSPVDIDLAVVYSPLMPISFRNLLLDRGYQLVEVPEEEFDSMGCNVLALGPRKCLMVAGNPITRERLLKAGAEVIEYEGNEISVKGGGGPTCLTRPWQRN